MSTSANSGAASGALPTVTRQDATVLVRQVNRLLNRQLSSVCQLNGLRSGGVKADLQSRIANLIQEALNANDGLRFQQIRQSVQNTISNASTFSLARSPAINLHSVGVQTPPPSMPYASHANGHRAAASSYGQPSRLTFKPSPFYLVENNISDVRTCEAMSQHRNSLSFSIKLNDYPSLQKCVDDISYRVMVFCAGDNTGVQDIAFPHQSELRVNGGEIKANLRGLKNKPGSTRPVDITNSLRLRPSYANNIDFTYALTNKKYHLVLNLCKVVSVDELAERIKNGNKIPKDSVVRELNKKAQDPDVVATSQVLSLKCPLTYMRLSVPCRGSKCTHIQCFDATSYLQLQEQGPQWLCPICNKSAPFDQLAVDEYVKDILEKTSKNLESVTIEPDGHWTAKSVEDDRHGSNQTNGNGLDDDDDDDLEISEVSIVGGRRFDTPKNVASSTGTPVSTGRNSTSLGPRGIASTSSKRPAAPVIDLTLSSDDEDDEPVRPAKRQNTSTNGFSNSSNHLDYLADPSIGFAP